MKEELVYHYFTDDDFLRISNKIKEMEKITAGEIRVSIKEKKHILHSRYNIRQIAEKEFAKLKMDKTRDRTGILLLLILNERQFYILADSGINQKVSEDTWDKIKNEIQSEFRKGHFTEGIILGIDKVGRVLSAHFPIKSDDTNELSNEVVI